MKTYKIKLENNKYNIYYFNENGKIETKEFYTGEVRGGYNLDITDSIFTESDLNKMQYDELLLTDWYFTRKMELNIEVPIDIINERLAIREKYNNLKTK